VCGDPLCIELDNRKVCRIYLDRLAEQGRLLGAGKHVVDYGADGLCRCSCGSVSGWLQTGEEADAWADAHRGRPVAEAEVITRYESVRDAARPVAAAARQALDRMQSDHAGAPLLKAIAQRLCQDIDETERVGERIAATRQVVALLQVLDGALFPGSHHAPPPGSGDDESPEAAGDTDDDDPFKIGQLPPGVGDAPT
jgi:hypothetical protein